VSSISHSINLIYYLIRQVPGLRQCNELADMAADHADEDDLNDILAARASRQCPPERGGESSSASKMQSSASAGASSDNAEDNLSVLSSIGDRATSPPHDDGVNAGTNTEDGKVVSIPVTAIPKTKGKGKKAARGKGKRR